MWMQRNDAVATAATAERSLTQIRTPGIGGEIAHAMRMRSELTWSVCEPEDT